MIDQSGKTVWITGASSGIGEALAKTFVANGGSAVLSGRTLAELQRVADETGAAERCLILPFDTQDFSCLPAMVDKALNFQGQVDVLVNNAGISQRSLAVETDFAVYERIVGVDLLAPIALTQALLPHLLARGVSDAAIDNGIDPQKVSELIWQAVAMGTRELLIAEGMEAGIPALRAQDPERLFDMLEAMVAQGYAQKMATPTNR